MTGNHRHLGGFVMAELMLALAVFTLVLTATIGITTQTQSSVDTSRHKVLASRLADEALAGARTLAIDNWDSLTAGTHGIADTGTMWQLQATATTHGVYSRDINVAVISTSDKRVTARVSWPAAFGQTKTLTQVTHLTNWRARQIENDISGDWRSPKTTGSNDLTPSGNAGRNLVLYDHYIYLVSQHSSAGSDEFHVYDIDVKPNPAKLASLNVGSSDFVSVSAYAGYGYAINNRTANQVYVVNVTNPSAPSVATILDCHTGARAKSSTVIGSLLVVGLEANPTGPEVCIFSLTNPAGPYKVGEIEIGASVNAAADFGQVLYLATSDDAREIMFFDMTVIAVPTLISSYDAPGSADGLSLFVKSEFVAYLGREGSTTDDFFILNTTNYGQPSLMFSYKTGASILSFVVINHLAFLGTNDPSNELKILDVAWGIPPTRYDTTPLNFPQDITGFTFKANTVYFSVRSNEALRVVGSS